MPSVIFLGAFEELEKKTD